MSERTELIIRAVGVVDKTDGTLYCGQVFYIGSGPATGTYRIESIETQESDPHSKIMGAAKELGWGIAIPHGEPESTILGYSIGTDEYLAAVDGNKAKVDQLNEQIEAGLQISGSSFEALKPLNLSAINVADPGQHVSDLIAERDRLQDEMRTKEAELRLRADNTVKLWCLRNQLTDLIATWRRMAPTDIHGSTLRACATSLERELTEALAASGEPAPIDMLLFCPRCGAQHVDAPNPSIGWDCPPHRSHLCHACKCIFRPADVPTNGVAEIQTKGKADTWDGFGKSTVERLLDANLDVMEADAAEADRIREANGNLAKKWREAACKLHAQPLTPVNGGIIASLWGCADELEALASSPPEAPCAQCGCTHASAYDLGRSDERLAQTQEAERLREEYDKLHTQLFAEHRQQDEFRAALTGLVTLCRRKKEASLEPAVRVTLQWCAKQLGEILTRFPVAAPPADKEAAISPGLKGQIATDIVGRYLIKTLKSIEPHSEPLETTLEIATQIDSGIFLLRLERDHLRSQLDQLQPLRFQTQIDLADGHGYQHGDPYTHNGERYYVCGFVRDAIFILPDRRRER